MTNSLAIKKIILLTITLFLISYSIKIEAQTNVNVTIEKAIENGDSYVKVSIKK